MGKYSSRNEGTRQPVWNVKIAFCSVCIPVVIQSLVVNAIGTNCQKDVPVNWGVARGGLCTPLFSESVFEIDKHLAREGQFSALIPTSPSVVCWQHYLLYRLQFFSSHISCKRTPFTPIPHWTLLSAHPTFRDQAVPQSLKRSVICRTGAVVHFSAHILTFYPVTFVHLIVCFIMI